MQYGGVTILGGGDVMLHCVVVSVASANIWSDWSTRCTVATNSSSLMTYLSHDHKPVALKPISAWFILTDLGYGIPSSS